MQAQAETLDEFGLPPLDDELLVDIKPLTEEELGIKFDELAELAINQPDDIVAMNGLGQLVSEAHSQGQIDAAMQMAMTLGAMACAHPHMEDVASDAGEMLGLAKKEDKKPDHDTATCANCKAGKRCTKKHQ